MRELPTERVLTMVEYVYNFRWKPKSALLVVIGLIGVST
jgi:hypothetical protein